MNLTAFYHMAVTKSILSSCFKNHYVERQHSIFFQMNDGMVLFKVLYHETGHDFPAHY